MLHHLQTAEAGYVATASIVRIFKLSGSTSLWNLALNERGEGQPSSAAVRDVKETYSHELTAWLNAKRKNSEVLEILKDDFVVLSKVTSFTLEGDPLSKQRGLTLHFEVAEKKQYSSRNVSEFATPFADIVNILTS